ncbi:MAG: TIR-like domain [Chloroflexi bacterium]|nr:MAG: TIR-like domain [Chloroflexota bacterium]
MKRRIFISFSHDDTQQVNGFLGLRNILDGFEFYNHKLDRRIQSTDDPYVQRVIRDEYLTSASVTIVLIGDKTADSKWVKWEIAESRRQGKGILGIRLKGTAGRVPEGIPSNAVGGWEPDNFAGWIEWAAQNRPAATRAR